SITGPIIVDESAGTVTYNITLTNPSVDTVTVDYTTADGSANAGLDYAATAGTVTFAPNEISKTVTVAIIDDNVAENNEDYSITLSNPSNAGIDATQNSVITTIVDNDTAPMIDSITSTTVSEEGLPGGLADNDALAGFDDTTNVTVQTGVITVFDPDSMSASDFSVILNGPAGITTSGALVSWTPSANGLIGSAIIEGNLVEVITMTVDAFTDNGNGNYSANYTATLLQPIDHPDMRGEDHLDLSFTATVSDGTNISNSQSFDLRVEDDAPVAIDVDVDVVVQPVNTNLLLVVDVSGSMNGSVNSTTRLALAKQALIEAINKYDEYGEVKVRLVTFDGGNDIIGPNWVSAADALVQINSLTAGGQTNYDAALAGAMSAFGDPGKIVTTIGQDGQGNPVNNVPLNKAIFITDGEPTVGSGGPGILTGGTTTGSADRGIQPAEEAIWTNFLSTNKIDMTAFSIVTLGSNTELDPIAFDGSTGIDTDGLTVTPQTLEQSILDSIDISTTTGNLINSSGGPAVEFGADGNRFNVTKINIDGGLYTFDKSNNQLTTTVSSSVFSYDQATTTVTVNTTAGGVIAVDFVSADYSYQAPQQVQPDYLETISYTAVDSDGDEDTTTLTLDITYLATSNSNIVASSMSRVADSDDMLEASDASIAAGLSVQAYTIEDVHTLYLDSDSIDLATASNIGVIEMTNGHSQSLNISLQDVIDITDDNNTLFINGDSANDTGGDADTVVLANFAKAPASNEMGYDLYQNHSSNTELYIDTDITVL
ncbi:Calx-beta domain-containing protein, partial [Psychrobacter jeotgali]|uniref:Calx-beta domain-containing protein n=1 Tax=Psychrobacter jeotgali TaxID=179010 RepID=UPI001D0FC2A2